jgi:hypothetical protein
MYIVGLLQKFLTGLISYENCLPAGSQCSPIVTYWTFDKLFNRINNFCKSKNLKFSLYVDDITIPSSEPISNKIYKTINSQLNRVGLNLHAEKQKKKYFQIKDVKLITGCSVLPSGNLDVPEDKKKEIRNLYNEIIAEPNEKK